MVTQPAIKSDSVLIMKDVYIVVDWFHPCYRPWPTGCKAGPDVLARIWGLDKVEFIRNNHPLGDLHRITVTDEDLTAMRLRSSVGTIVTDIDAIR